MHTGSHLPSAGNPNGVPLSLLHNLKHNKVLHQHNILLTVLTLDVAHVEDADRLEVEPMREGFCRVVAKYGFMDTPNVPQVLKRCQQEHDLACKLPETTFFLSSETILAGKERTMAAWRKWLFAVLSRNAQRATAYFRLPANRVVELGMQIEL